MKMICLIREMWDLSATKWGKLYVSVKVPHIQYFSKAKNKNKIKKKSLHVANRCIKHPIAKCLLVNLYSNMTVERFDVVAYGICLLMYHMMLLRWCALLSIMYAHVSNGLQLQLSSTKIPTMLPPLSTFIYRLLNSFALDVPSETEKKQRKMRK